MSSNYIIELNQNDPRANVKQNGDYSVNITEKTILNNGDSIMLNKAFIDTVAQANNKIKIENDIELKIGFSKWIWYINTQNKVLEGKIANGQPFPYQTNGQTASPCIVSRPAPNCSRILNIKLTSTGNGQPFGNDQTMTFTYKDPLGEQRTSHLKLITYQAGESPATEPVFLQSFLLQTGETPTIVDKEDLFSKANLSNLEFDLQPVANAVYFPKNYSISYTLPAGNYDPVELGSIISEGLTTAYNKNNYEYVGNINSLITGNNELFALLDVDDLLIPTKSTMDIFDAGSDNIVYGHVVQPQGGDVTIFAGCSQFAFEWLEDLNKFTFNTVHTPITDDQGTTSYTGYQAEGMNPGVGNVSLVSAYSGICFNSLEPVSFWQDQCGFEITDLTSWWQDQYVRAFVSLPDWQWRPSIYQTSGQVLLNALTKNGAQIGDASDGSDYLNTYINIEDSNQILARNQILNSAGSPATSYFLIEINSKFNNTFLSSIQNHRNIQAIISTYYSTASATIGSSSDSIVYTHRGAPIELSGFDIRILDENKEVASKIINDNNVVFLQVIRAENNQMIKEKKN